MADSEGTGGGTLQALLEVGALLGGDASLAAELRLAHEDAASFVASYEERFCDWPGWEAAPLPWLALVTGLVARGLAAELALEEDEAADVMWAVDQLFWTSDAGELPGGWAWVTPEQRSSAELLLLAVAARLSAQGWTLGGFELDAAEAFVAAEGEIFARCQRLLAESGWPAMGPVKL